jgi:hypothetical protein
MPGFLAIDKKSRDSQLPRLKTTKGGLENNIPKDVAVQYKVYIAMRQLLNFSS